MKTTSLIFYCKLLTLVVFLILIGITSFFFQGCQKESFNEYQEFLDIEGDLNDPFTLNNLKNSGVFYQASVRLIQKVFIDEDKKLAWKISTGSEINISEKLFRYMSENLARTNNRILTGDLEVFYDKNKMINYYSPNNLLTPNLKIPRLKKSSNESPSNSGDLSGMNQQRILENLVGFYNQYNWGNVGDYYNMSSINWTTGGGTAHISGWGTINGKTASYCFNNGCYYQPNNNCWANEIGQYDSYQYSDRSFYWIRNILGLPLITITIYD